MMETSCAIVWFRQDLRLDDHPALREACARGVPVIPVFIWSPEEEGDWTPGEASRWWLDRSMRVLSAALERKGSRLIIGRGDAGRELGRLARETGARSVFWTKRYEPDARRRQEHVIGELSAQSLECRQAGGSLLHEPGTILNGSGEPYKIFKAYFNASLAAGIAGEPVDAPTRIPSPARWPASLEMESLGLVKDRDLAESLGRYWNPGCEDALARLDEFLAGELACYAEDRDRPGRLGTSRLSPCLHYGEISPRRIWSAICEAMGQRHGQGYGRHAEAFLRQLVWRDFAHHLLFFHPRTPEEPLRPEFAAFPWEENAQWLERWKQGRTGFPIVDAGMRELLETGWMHNRVRMIVASFLVKDLLISWQDGARWFWERLVDADLANNTFGWQWSAGCGADAAPYYRIFNPSLQAERFDPEGEYVRRWVPELRQGKPGEGYPEPVVNHSLARKVALAHLAKMKRRMSEEAPWEAVRPSGHR